MKWWKRLLRRRFKRAFGLKELQRAIQFVRVMYKIIASLLIVSRTIQRRDTKRIVRLFGKMLSKRY